jgi:hypothetical protein
MEKNKTGKYLKYAIGEILLVVIGILIALSINNWNQAKTKVVKEIEILKSFQNQLENDLVEFDESLTFYKGAKKSIDVILNHLENDLPYNDSINLHFFISTRTWGTSDLDNNVFETLKSIGIDLISNRDVRKQIVKIYEDDDVWIKEFEATYINFLFNASETIFNLRFKSFWEGDYTDLTFQGEMVPLNFDKLKSDQEYLYFLRTQKNHIGWLIEKPIETTRTRVLELLTAIKKEIDRLENK